MRVKLEKEVEGNIYKGLKMKEAFITDLEFKVARWKVRKWRDAADGKRRICIGSWEL